MAMSEKKIGRMVTADVDKALANIGASTPKPEMGTSDELKKATGPSRDLTRGEAFRLARMKAKLAGEDPSKATFTWGGKTYHTRMAGEGAKKPAPVTRRTTQQVGTNKNAAPPPPPPPSPPPPAPTRAPTRAAPKAEPKRDNTAAGRRERMGRVFASLNPFRDTSAREKEIAKAASKPRDYAADRARMKAEKLAEKAARRKELGIREPKMAKGGKIDGCAVRGKTRAMKKGK